jgi:hypothetical protein
MASIGRDVSFWRRGMVKVKDESVTFLMQIGHVHMFSVH